MGVPTWSHKRARYSPSLEEQEASESGKFMDWSPILQPSFSSNSISSSSSTFPPCPSPVLGALDHPRLHHSAPEQREAGRATSPFGDLSEPLLLKILQMSQPTAWDLCRLSCVNRAWRKACSHSCFWTRLCVGTGSLRSGAEQLAPRCTALAELFIDDPHCELHILHPILYSCADSLRRVVIDCDKDSSTRNEASVSSLLWLISLYCKNVESIELQSNGQDSTIGCLEGRTMRFLTTAFRNVRNFTCLAKGSLTRQCVYLMAIAWPKLESLRINMEVLNTEDLLALRKCPSLRALELVGGSLSTPARPPAAGAASSAAPSAQHSERAGASSSQHLFPSLPGGACPAKNPNMSSVPQGVDSAAGTASNLPPRQQGATIPPMGRVFHSSLELLVLNRMEFLPEDAAELALACPSLRRILVSGPLCEACLGRQGTSTTRSRECVRNRVDCVQEALAKIRRSRN